MPPKKKGAKRDAETADVGKEEKTSKRAKKGKDAKKDESKADKPRPLVLGSVAYGPQVYTIWEGFKHYWEKKGFAFDWILYSNYESQVRALVDGHIDVAWNSPLAWIQAKKLAEEKGRHARAIAMRDTDCGMTSVIVVREDSKLKEIGDLKGCRIAFGATDSPQATLLPIYFLETKGLTKDSYTVVHHNIGVGLHGDHVGGEKDGFKALLDKGCDAACVLESNYNNFAKDKALVGEGKKAIKTRVLARTPAFDHCNMTIVGDGKSKSTVLKPDEAWADDRIKQFQTELLACSYDNAELTQFFDLEGLKKWVPARTSGYGDLETACGQC